MPSKIPQEAEIDSDDGEEMMPMGAGYPGMPERKEYLWSCDLKGKIIFHKQSYGMTHITRKLARIFV